MPRLDTADEVTAFLERFAAAEKVRSLPPLTEAEYAEAEQAFADAPPGPPMSDDDADATFAYRNEFAPMLGDELTGMYGDPSSPDGF